MTSQKFKLIFTTLITVLFILSFQLSFAQDSASFHPKNATYLWPTNASNALSGTFAETRSRHFHAALDIKTWGRRGYPVYATRDGILHRMAIGPTGYGKILYLKHDDGSYSLYAHLLRFNDSLQQIADSIRLSNYSSSFDVITDSMNIQIEQGEQIALSGASGIGPPHLHFELRTPNEEPFNPLLTNLKIRDNIAPTFSGLAVEPLSIETKIEDRNRIYTKRARRGTEFADFGTISVQGPFGLAVDVFDQANNVSNVYAVYSLQMKVDGKTVFESKTDQFSYSKTDQMHIDRIYTLLETTGRAYQRLYVADGNTLSFYKTYGNAGRLDLSPGVHQISIEATDYYGNRRRARATIIVQPPTSQPAQVDDRFYQSNNRDINPDEWTWFKNWVNIPVEDFRQLTLAPLLSSPAKQIYIDNGGTVSVDLNSSPQFYFRTSVTDHFIMRRVHPFSPAYLNNPDKQAYASFPSVSFYDTASVAMQTERFAPDSIRVSFFPDNIPIRKSFDVSVRVDSAQLADTTLSFYKTYPGSRYLRKLTTQKRGNYLTASPSNLGTYLILSDKKPPRLGSMRIVKSPDDKWLVYISAWDRRSGIDYEKTEVYVNGVRGITEYEPESGRLVYYHPNFLPEPTNTVKVVAYDVIGNKAVKRSTIRR